MAALDVLGGLTDPIQAKAVLPALEEISADDRYRAAAREAIERIEHTLRAAQSSSSGSHMKLVTAKHLSRAESTTERAARAA